MSQALYEQQTNMLRTQMYNVAHLSWGGYSIHFIKIGQSIWLLDR